MQISPALSRDVQMLEKQFSDVKREAEKAEQDSRKSLEEATALYQDTGFRERNLNSFFCGLLGGDLDKVRRLKVLDDAVRQFNEAASAKRYQAQRLDREANEKIHDWLAGNDEEFEKIIIPWEAARILNNAVQSFSGKISAALRMVDDADQVDTYDLYTKNLGYASGPRNAQANAYAAIETAKSAVPAFKKAVSLYVDQMQAADLSGLEIKTDIRVPAWSFYGDSFDSARSGLRGMRHDAQAIGSVALQNFKAVDKMVTARIADVRAACQPL